MKYKLYTDGACSVNTGYGGWGSIIIDESEKCIEFSGAEKDTTNNRMELTAVLKGLLALKDMNVSELTIYTDSAYVANCFINSWWKKWLVNGWRKANGTAIKNQDLWTELFKILLKGGEDAMKWEFVHVRGHSDDFYNNKCDKLAVKAKEELAAYEAIINFN